ncbi:hypothetical protein NDU88_003118 [Pleurodeles waltl]|uniref:Uncharacterized protein n=1 Tax=Pleurodeles waltl TaxID=8319 RepID=A0AAV7W539_PLEWA|nr:hypothetical protein NDU88_003118 [Pleurodeles waltl]
MGKADQRQAKLTFEGGKKKSAVAGSQSCEEPREEDSSNGAKTRAAAERRRGRAHTGCARVCGTQEERADRGGACAGR